MIEYTDYLWTPGTRFQYPLDRTFTYDAFVQLCQNAKSAAIAGAIPTVQEILEFYIAQWSTVAGEIQPERKLWPIHGPNDQWMEHVDACLNSNNGVLNLDSSHNHLHRPEDRRSRILVTAVSPGIGILARLKFSSMFLATITTPIDGLYTISRIRKLKDMVKNQTFRGIRLFDKYPFKVAYGSETYLNHSDISDAREALNGYTFKPIDVWVFTTIKRTYGTCDHLTLEADYLVQEPTSELDITKNTFTLFGRDFALADILRKNNLSKTPPAFGAADYSDNPGVNPKPSISIYEIESYTTTADVDYFIKAARVRYYDYYGDYWARRLSGDTSTFTATLTSDTTDWILTIECQATTAMIMLEFAGTANDSIPGRLNCVAGTNVFKFSKSKLTVLSYFQLTGLVGVTGYKLLINDTTVPPQIQSIQIFRNGVEVNDITLGDKINSVEGEHVLRITLDYAVKTVAQVFVQCEGFYAASAGSPLQDDYFIIGPASFVEIPFTAFNPHAPTKGLITAVARGTTCIGAAYKEVECTRPVIKDHPQYACVGDPAIPANTFNAPYRTNSYGPVGSYLHFFRVYAGYWLRTVGNTFDGGCGNIIAPILRPPSLIPISGYGTCGGPDPNDYWFESDYTFLYDAFPLFTRAPKFTDIPRLRGKIVPRSPIPFPLDSWTDITYSDVEQDWNINTLYETNTGWESNKTQSPTDDGYYNLRGLRIYQGVFSACFMANELGFGAGTNRKDYFNLGGDLKSRIDSDVSTLFGQISTDWPVLVHGTDNLFAPTGEIGLAYSDATYWSSADSRFACAESSKP